MTAAVQHPEVRRIHLGGESFGDGAEPRRLNKLVAQSGIQCSVSMPRPSAMRLA